MKGWTVKQVWQHMPGIQGTGDQGGSQLEASRAYTVMTQKANSRD